MRSNLTNGNYCAPGGGFAKTSKQSSPALICLAQPLVDISAYMSEEFVKKHDLIHGGWQPAEQKHAPVFAALKNQKDVRYTLGGSTLNSIKVAQKISKKSPGFCGGIGCIGSDEIGKLFRETLHEVNVAPLLITRPKAETGQCAVLIDPKNAERTMITNLGAGRTFCGKDAVVFATEILRCEIMLMSAFFFKNLNGSETLHFMADMLRKSGGAVALSLGASPLWNETGLYRKELEEFLPRTDIVFMNEDEALAYGRTFIPEKLSNEQDELEKCKEIGRYIATLPKEERDIVDKFPARVVVITRGGSAAVLATGDEITTHQPQSIAKELVIDTNGAGDTFCGGFLAALLEGGSYKDGMRLGQHCALKMIQVLGCETDCLGTLTASKFISNSKHGDKRSLHLELEGPRAAINFKPGGQIVVAE